MRILILSTNILWCISHYKKNSEQYDQNVIGLNVKFLFFSGFIETGIFSTGFRKYMKFHENAPNENRVIPRVQMDGRTDKQTWRS
jgi:hypothetical protein